MGEGKHTKGPWTVRYRFGRKTTVVGRQRYPICDTGTAPHAETNQRREEANAHLIAAAPDLLQALEGLSRIVRSADVAMVLLSEASAAWSNVAEALKASEFAIAKARGPEQ